MNHWQTCSSVSDVGNINIDTESTLSNMDADPPLIIGKVCPTCLFKYSPDLERCPDDNSILAVIKRDPFIGKMIADKYQIIEILGMGGFSTVYKAEQTSLRRVVAVKILHAEFVDKPDKIRRFQHEAESISTLVHSNVASVYDYGVLAQGQPYLVLEYAPGKTLSAVLSETKVLSPERAVNIFIQCCDGVAAAHRKGIIHRDLKPSNIVLLESEEGIEHVKVLDFGLAKVISGDGSAHENLTLTGEVLGTPAYMAPEQCMGTAMDLRTDIYCFGCVMYEALSGKLPLEGDSSYEVMHKHINEAPITLSKSGASVPTRLVRIVNKALQKDPDDRYQNFEELKDALMGVEPDFTSEIKSVLFSGRNAKLSKKNKAFRRKVFLASWCAVLLFTAVAGLLVYERGQAVRKDQIAKRYANKLSKFDNGQVTFEYPAEFHATEVPDDGSGIVEHFEHRVVPNVSFDIKFLDSKAVDGNDRDLLTSAKYQRTVHASYPNFSEIRPLQEVDFGSNKTLRGYETEFIYKKVFEGYFRERHIYFGTPDSIWKLKFFCPLDSREKYEKMFDIVFSTVQLKSQN